MRLGRSYWITCERMLKELQKRHGFRKKVYREDGVSVRRATHVCNYELSSGTENIPY